MKSQRRSTVAWRFVDYIPRELDEGVVYIAAEFGAVIHLCCDGCGERISTPLGKAQWSLTFDGESISLWPSVGNWALPCRSHYIIRENHVIWAGQWSPAEVAASAARDRAAVETVQVEPAATQPNPLCAILRLQLARLRLRRSRR